MDGQVVGQMVGWTDSIWQNFFWRYESAKVESERERAIEWTAERQGACWSFWMWLTLLWDRCPSRTSTTHTHACHIPGRWIQWLRPWIVACRATESHFIRRGKRRKKWDAGGGWQFDSSACYFHPWVHAVQTNMHTLYNTQFPSIESHMHSTYGT